MKYVPAEDSLGTVVAQSPTSGATAKQRSHVTVNVSSGPGEKEQKLVPDAGGQTLDEAVVTMNRAGLRLVFVKLNVTDRAQAGKVVEQTPRARRSCTQNAG